MRKTVYFVVGILLISSLTAIGISSGAGGLQAIKFEKKFEQPIVIEKQDYAEIEVNGANSYLFSEGKPLLPVYRETITLPFGIKVSDVSYTLGNVYTKAITKQIKPSPQPVIKGVVSKNQVSVKDENVYSSDEYYPSDWFSYRVGVGLDENMQHKTFVTITTYPVRYLPSSNTLKYADEINIKLYYNKPDKDPFTENAEYDLVIIAPDKFTTDLQPLVDHKNKYGVKTFIKTTSEIYSEYSGVDKPEKIKYFIKDAIEQLGVKYVLIVGGLKNLIYADPMDTENYGDKWWHVPVRWSNLDLQEPGPVSDLYYSDIYKEGGEFEDWNKDGDDLIGEWTFTEKQDLYPDVALGRLACRNNDEVRSVVDKIINYETNTYNSDWFEKMIVVSGDGFLDQEDLNFEWDTNGLPDGDYTIYAQSNNDEGEFGPIEAINVTIDKTQATSLTFNHDDYTRVPDYPHYPAPPIAEIVSVTEGDIIGNTDFFYEPSDGEAYINSQLHWANVEYENGILHIRGKTYDPKPYGNLTDMHVWVKNSNDEIVFEDWRNNSPMYSEGDWTTGEKPLLGRAGALYYMPSSFEKQKLWSSNGNWYGPDDVINAISKGSGFVFFSGHGSPNVWANHYPGIPGNRAIADVEGLRVSEFDGFKLTFQMNELSNEYKLPVIVVGGCHNSMFTVSLIPSILNMFIHSNNMHTYGLPTPECWGWWPVKMSKSGAIATIGNTGYGYGYLGEYCTTGGVDNWITTEFFLQYGTNGHDILGEAHAQSLTSYINNIGLGDEGDAKTVEQWVLLGDPSLKLGGYPPQTGLKISVNGKEFKPEEKITIEVVNSEAASYNWEIDTDGDGIFDYTAHGKNIQYQWKKPGVYWVKAEKGDTTGLTVVEIKNDQPNKPTISGPTIVKQGQTYTYTVKGSDPNNDELYYLVEWGDNTYNIITPGDNNKVQHRFTKNGEYEVKILAIDNHGDLSGNTLKITCEKTRAYNTALLTLFNNILEKHPNAFPMLRQLLKL